MNYRKVVAGLAITASALGTAVFAQDATVKPDHAVGDIAGRFYVSPMYSYSFASKDRRSDDAQGGMLAIGKQMNPQASLELFAAYNQYGAETAGDSDGELLTAGLAVLGFPFALRDDGVGRWLGGAFALGAVSYADASKFPLRVQKYDQNREGYAIDLGLGYLARTPYVRFASLRLDARYRMNFATSPFASVEIRDEANEKANINDVVTSIGVLVPIGAGPKPPEPPPAPLIVAPVAPPDSDGDGVPDNLDQCPGTAPGVKVDDKGCAIPACSKPAPGERISLNGCGAGDVIVLSGVNFEFDQARLTANAETILNDVADELNKFVDVTVEVAGHTDSLGADAYNQNLSEQRAAAVRDYLVGKGIAAERMTAVGQGEAIPVDSNETEEGRERNRRVELKILSGGPAPQIASPAPAAAAPVPAADLPPSADPSAVTPAGSN